MYALEGEEMWFADFVNKKGVEPQPSFIDHMSYREGTYEQAVANQQICKSNLKIVRTSMKDIPLNNGKEKSNLKLLSFYFYSTFHTIEE